MPDRATLEAVLAPISAGRATVSFDAGRASIVLDVTGLATDAQAEMEADVKAAAAAQPGVSEVRVLLTSERMLRRMIAVASGKGGVGMSTIAWRGPMAGSALGQLGDAEWGD